MNNYLFKDRIDAGQRLADRLKQYSGMTNALVLALPRGGVPVAYQIAYNLKIPLDIFLVRKLGVPGQEELAMGAIASGGVQVLNNDIVDMLNISDQDIKTATEKEQGVLKNREQLYRGSRAPLVLTNNTVILVDDGIATGATMIVAIKAIRKLGCDKIIVAVPVCPTETINRIATMADEFICLATPEPFYAIGNWYYEFRQTTDDEVISLLENDP